MVPLELVDLLARGGDLIVTRVEPREGTQKAEKRLLEVVKEFHLLLQGARNLGE